jgi:hypothetical protein
VLAGAILVSFWLARTFAYRLYLPHRVVQHTLPYLAVVSIPIVFYACGLGLLRSEGRATIFALVVGVLPIFVLCGDGLSSGGYKDYRRDGPLYAWLEKNTKPTSTFAGSLKILDEIPLFAARQPYVNWMMAHPFREGYYREIDRRMRAMFDAYYANTVKEVIDFADHEDIEYFIVDAATYKKVPKGRGNNELYEPLGSAIQGLWESRREAGFALDPPPPEAVVFRHGAYAVVSVPALRALTSTP